jgi:kynurenine formamidase
MIPIKKVSFTFLILLMLTNLTSADSGTSGYTPDSWWPSEWGPDDELGALNRLDSQKVLQAAALIKQGVIYDMTRIYSEDMPLFNLTPGARKFTISIPGAPSWGPLGKNKLAWNEEFISGHLGQDGTQFDALCHMGTVLGEPGDLNGIRYYNGHSHADIGTGRGFTKLGVEKVTPIFTRGILIDIAGYKGRMMERSEEFSLEDIKAALKKQGMSVDDIKTGDAVFYHTGWGSLWGVDNDKFNSGTPGMSDKTGDWIVEKKVVLVGSDNWAVEAIPGPDQDNFAPNHQKFLVENGIYIMENLDFSSLISAEVYEFAFVFGAMPIKGATGSPGRPFAIR